MRSLVVIFFTGSKAQIGPDNLRYGHDYAKPNLLFALDVVISVRVVTWRNWRVIEQSIVINTVNAVIPNKDV